MSTDSPSPAIVKLARITASALTGLPMSQQQAAEKIGASARIWRAWESGTRNMPRSKYRLFCLLTGIEQ